MVVYFSGTGNSRFCALRIARALGLEAIDAHHYIKNGIAADLHSGGPWVFVCPTYAWKLPRLFADFIKSGSFSGGERAWFVMTCGDDVGAAGRQAAALCGEKGLDYMGLLQVIMPENYLAMFPVPGPGEAEKIRVLALPGLEAGIEQIRRGEAFAPLPEGIIPRLKSGVVNRAFYSLFVKDKKFYAEKSCISCGKCAELCPLNNIKLVEGKPQWGGNCSHCMACICRCPVSAIEYGKASRGKSRYFCPEE